MFYRVNLTEEIRPDDFLGQHVDEATATLKSIVTTTGTDGRVSARGINLDRILREREVERQKEREQYHEMAWQKKQVLRRQVRRKRNERRAERRFEVQQSGGNPDDEVSADEDDSEFEFEVEPDRLTPPSTPEPGTAMLPEGEEGEEGVEQEERDGEEPLFLPEEGEEGEGEGEWPQHPAEERHEEDEDMRELRAAGFTFRADDEPEPEEDDEAEHYEGDYDHDQWHHDEDDEIAAARANIELSRRRVIERNEEREVVEEDEAGKMVNNASHKKLRPNDKWTWEETEFFYMVSDGLRLMLPKSEWR
jgi:transcription factor TFIIIB component B''